MTGLRVLQGAMMLQIGLGLWRFAAAYLGWPIELRVWQVHPVLGIGIAVAALVLFRRRAAVVPTRLWTASRYIAFAPLLLGLSLRYGVLSGEAVTVAHMIVGVTALGLMDTAIKRELVHRNGVPVTCPSSSEVT